MHDYQFKVAWKKLSEIRYKNIKITLRRHTVIRINIVVPETNPNGSDLNARSAARRAEGKEACSNAGIQRLESLDYEMQPCISSSGPAVGCSNLLHAD